MRTRSAEELVAGVRVVQLDAGEVHAAQAVGAVQGAGVHVVLDRQGGAEPRPARRVELLDEDVDVARGLFGGDVAGRRRQADHFQLSGSNRASATANAPSMPGSDHEDHLAGHSSLLRRQRQTEAGGPATPDCSPLSRTSPSSTAAARPSVDRLRGALDALGQRRDPLGRQQRGRGVGQHDAQRRPLPPFQHAADHGGALLRPLHAQLLQPARRQAEILAASTRGTTTCPSRTSRTSVGADRLTSSSPSRPQTSRARRDAQPGQGAGQAVELFGSGRRRAAGTGRAPGWPAGPGS